MSDILYSKLRLQVPQVLDGANATITSQAGNVRTVQMSSPITDIMLAGMEKYRVQAGITDEDVSFGYGQIKKIGTTGVSSISVTTMPTKTLYIINQALNLNGLVVSATTESYDGEGTKNVTSDCTYSPANGTILTTAGTIPVNVNYGNHATSFNVTCLDKPPYYDELKSGTTLTEAQWLAFLNGNGIKYIITKGEASTFRGKKVSLTNSADSTYTTWSIGDFNHDGTSYTCDLILDNTIHSATFGSSQTYSSSAARTWLIGTYYNGFSTNIKNKLKTMAVASNGVTLSDKVKLLSADEVGITPANTFYQYSVREGTRYPIFPSGGTGQYEVNSDRKRTGANTIWWLRSRHTNDINLVYGIYPDGSFIYNHYNNSYGMIPVIRFA